MAMENEGPENGDTSAHISIIQKYDNSRDQKSSTDFRETVSISVYLCLKATVSSMGVKHLVGNIHSYM